MINLLTLFYSFSGLVPGTGPRSQLNKLGDKDLCCVGVETLNHLQCSVCSPQHVININHEASRGQKLRQRRVRAQTAAQGVPDLRTFP